MAHDPATEKRKVRQSIEQRVGRTFQAETRRPDWRATADDRLGFFLTFSNIERRTNKSWYDVNQDDIGRWSRYSRFFVVFVLEDFEHNFVVPLSDVQTWLKSRVAVKDGTYKLHIQSIHGRYELVELPRVDLMRFYNNFDLLAA
jgi:hypothetical protein